MSVIPEKPLGIWQRRPRKIMSKQQRLIFGVVVAAESAVAAIAAPAAALTSSGTSMVALPAASNRSVVPYDDQPLGESTMIWMFTGSVALACCWLPSCP